MIRTGRSPTTVIGKLWALLTIVQRRAAIALLGLMLFGALMETLGIGLVIPVLGVMTQPELVQDYPAFGSVLGRLGNPGPTALMIGAVGVLVVFFALKALFLSTLAWRQMGFVFGLQVDLADRLFAEFLRQPYAFHLQRNSAQLVRCVTGQVSDITTVTLGGILLLTELQVLIGIGMLLIVIEPVGALLVAASLGGAGWIFHRRTRDRTLDWGNARQLHEAMRLQHLMQGLGGVKDVKLLGREADFLAQFREQNVALARIERRQATLQQLPRLGIELLAVVGLAALVIVMVSTGRSVDAVLPTLGLFAAAAFRMMPSVNRMLGGLQALKYIQPAVNSMYTEFERLSRVGTAPRSGILPFKHSLELEHVSYRYPAADSATLHDITLRIPHGKSIGFIGTSGAGKSTLVDVLLGLLTPQGGTIRLDGADIQDNIRGWQDQIGYVPQTIFLTDDTLRRNVAFGISEAAIDAAAVSRAIRAAQLDNFVAELTHGLETVVGERGVRLSGGQRQRVGIARALYHDPQVLVLDEATSSLDVPTEAGVMQAVRALQGSKTIVIVAHRASTVMHCDWLFRIERGAIVEQGVPDAVLANVPANPN